MHRIFVFLLALLWANTAQAAPNTDRQTMRSPNGQFVLTFELNGDGEPFYALTYKGKPVILPSKLGFYVKDMPDLASNFKVAMVDSTTRDETWEPVWGEVKRIRNHYKELSIRLKQPATAKNRQILLRFRLFDDGLGFRYEFPEQEGLQYFVVTDERTEFRMAANHNVFWIPGDYDTNEYSYSLNRFSEINAHVKAHATGEIFSRSIIGGNYVQTPLLLKSPDGLYISLHEAALVNYPAMQLDLEQRNFVAKAHLVPDALKNRAYLQAPCHTPWRTVVVSDKATDLLASKLILNLNEPSKIADPSWIKPQKMIGIWWEMHVGKSTWNYADVGNVKLGETDWSNLRPNGKHGATTENTLRYIDFAAAHGFDGVLVEGWNVGWEDWFGNYKEEVFDFVTPYPDFDVARVNIYAAQKGVKLIMHHETSSSVTNYERRLDRAIAFMQQYGYQTVKTGYVGFIIPRGEHHDGQWMVNHYNRVAETLAKSRMMLDAHEPVRPTGLHRTYPNWLASEAARGNEFNAWSVGNPPEHETILPFTRLMGGPMDYTPGIFQIKLDVYKAGKPEHVHTTLAKQLALYLTMYSPLQMAADLPENYARYPDAFQFIKDVAVDWDDTRYLAAEPGDYIAVARKAKNRDREWFIGAITDESARDLNVKLDFLDPQVAYVATIYRDAENAHWDTNPMAYRIEKVLVGATTELRLQLAPGGGTAIRLTVATPEEVGKLKK